MLGNILPPYHSLQELNLDWILTKVKDMLRFLPDDGSVGQILRRTAHGAEWSNEQGGGGAVSSVNGQTGDVVLTAADVGALADTTPIPTQTSDLVNDSGFVDAAGAAAAAPVQSVNGQTGAVSLTIPTDTSDLTNTAGFVDAAGAAAAAPVQSVNSQTGAVSLTIPTDTSDLTNTAGFVDAAGAAAAAPVQSVNGQTGAVVISAGGITIDQLWTNNSPTSNFAAQSVSCDLTGYDYYAVRMAFGASATTRYIPLMFFPVNTQENQTSITPLNSNNAITRTYTYDDVDKEVDISDARNNGTVNNAQAIPIYILGIKI